MNTRPVIVWRHRGCRCVLLRVYLTPRGWLLTWPPHRDTSIHGVEEARLEIHRRTDDPIRVRRLRVPAGHVVDEEVWPLDQGSWLLDQARLSVSCEHRPAPTYRPDLPQAVVRNDIDSRGLPALLRDDVAEFRATRKHIQRVLPILR